VALSGVADGQVLTYDGTLTKWKNAAPTGGSPTYANLPTGSVFTVHYDGANWLDEAGTSITARPTSRTDIRMFAVNQVDTTVPSFALSGDILLTAG
jgi:hypothetical protein